MCVCVCVCFMVICVCVLWALSPEINLIWLRGPTSNGRKGNGGTGGRRGERRNFGPSQCWRQIDAPDGNRRFKDVSVYSGVTFWATLYKPERCSASIPADTNDTRDFHPNAVPIRKNILRHPVSMLVPTSTQFNFSAVRSWFSSPLSVFMVHHSRNIGGSENGVNNNFTMTHALAH